MVVVTNLTLSGLKKPPLGGFFIFDLIKDIFLQDSWIVYKDHGQVAGF